MPSRCPRLLAPLSALAWLVLTWAVAPVSGAEAQPGATKRVVIEPFEGRGGDQARLRLLSGLEMQPGIQIASDLQVRDAMDGMGITGFELTPEQYVDLATRLGVAAFVGGEVRSSGRRTEVTVVVRGGSDGREMGRESFRGRTPRVLAQLERQAYGRLQPYFELSLAPTGPVPGGGTGGGEWGASQGGGGEDAPWWGEDGSGSDDEDEDEEGDGEPSAPWDQTAWDGLEVEAGVGFLLRDMVANARAWDDLSVPFGERTIIDEQRTFQGGNPEVGLAARVWPGAFGEDDSFPYVGAEVALRHSMGLSLTGPTVDGRTIDVPASQYEFYLGGLGRYRLEEGGPELRAALGWGLFVFDQDVEALKELTSEALTPPLSYQYVHLGVEGSHWLVEGWLEVGARLGYRVGLGVGQEAQEIWGTETTGFSGFLLGARARVNASFIAEDVYLAADVSWFRFTTKWEGATACIEPSAGDECQDSDLWPPWPYAGEGMEGNIVGGIADPVDDDYIRLGLAIGYALR